MNLYLHGKRALVTGSSSGIGAEIARMLASKGVKVVVHGRDETLATALNANRLMMVSNKPKEWLSEPLWPNSSSRFMFRYARPLRTGGVYRFPSVPPRDSGPIPQEATREALSSSPIQLTHNRRVVAPGRNSVDRRGHVLPAPLAVLSGPSARCPLFGFRVRKFF